MRDILFLAHRVPWPPDRGDRIRSYHLLRHLAGLARVHLVAFDDEGADADALRPLCGRIEIVPRRRSRAAAGLLALAGGRPVSVEAFGEWAMHQAVRRALFADRIDTIFAFSGQMAQHVPTSFTGRFVMDFVDVDSAKFDDYAAQGGPMRWLHAREARLLAAYEADVAARADVATFVSEAEAALFRARSGATNVAVVENGIDLAHYDPAAAFDRLPARAGLLIVFTGQMDYPPNVTAVASFARHALPAIRARHPAARFAIVGRAPSAEVRALSRLPGVEVIGAVPDTRPWLAAADVVVAPLGIARGVQNKVLEAMAMARPVIASSAAFEGIDATPGRALIVAEGDAAVAAVADLLDNPERAAALGAAARARMVERYAWDARLAGLADLLRRNDHSSLSSEGSTVGQPQAGLDAPLEAARAARR